VIFRILLYIFLILWLRSNLTLAQVDPSNASLLRSSSQSPDKSSLDSSRYTIRPEITKSQPLIKRPASPLETQKNKIIGPKKPSNFKSNFKEKPSQSDFVQLNQELKASKENQKKEVIQVENFFWRGAEGAKDFKSLLHPQDTRQNLLEIGVDAGVLYQDSRSNYWYRRYSSSSPMLSANMTLWLTPFLGFRADFMTSMSSDMKGDPTTHRRIPVDHQWWSGQVRFRKSFGLDRKSPHILIGIGLNEYRINVPTNDLNRIRVHTSGSVIELGLQKPSSVDHIWELGVQVLPQAKQKEKKTGIKVQSGSKQDTNGVGFWIGSRFVIDRKRQFYWRLSHTLNKSLYKGQANMDDPIEGTKPEGVYVKTGITLFKVGYTWAE